MSLDYRFSIAPELDAQRVLKMALAELGLTPETALTEEGAFKETHGPGFLASAGPTAVMQRMILKEGLEIDPTASERDEARAALGPGHARGPAWRP
jgi:hypothetical protein